MIEGTLRVNGTSQRLVATLFWEMPFLVDNVLLVTAFGKSLPDSERVTVLLSHWSLLQIHKNSTKCSLNCTALIIQPIYNNRTESHYLQQSQCSPLLLV